MRSPFPQTSGSWHCLAGPDREFFGAELSIAIDQIAFGNNRIRPGELWFGFAFVPLVRPNSN